MIYGYVLRESNLILLKTRLVIKLIQLGEMGAEIHRESSLDRIFDAVCKERRVG